MHVVNQTFNVLVWPTTRQKKRPTLGHPKPIIPPPAQLSRVAEAFVPEHELFDEKGTVFDTAATIIMILGEMRLNAFQSREEGR